MATPSPALPNLPGLTTPDSIQQPSNAKPQGSNVIAFIVGTTAELIKIAPVYHALTARGTKPALWFTAQHVDEVADTLEDLRLPEPDVWMVPRSKARDLETPAQVPAWAAAVAGTAVRRRAELREVLNADGRPPLVIVHGDTFTTPYGSIVGRILKARVAHVEAGMRSGSWLSPFPEELNRRFATRLTDIHFAPTGNEFRNLEKSRGVVVDTGANTVIDAMRDAIRSTQEDLPDRFGVATLHRFELLQRPEKYREALELLRKASSEIPIMYLAGAPERDRIERHQLQNLFDERFRILPKRRYLEFIPLLARASFVVTDSGGLQEECAYLGVPCAIHRERTERHQGIGENIVLTKTRATDLEQFLDSYESMRRPSLVDTHFPSQVIADALAGLGYC
jgi:UDP-N-acetylglucosamine 2-epimerase (non-hydrolysing)